MVSITTTSHIIPSFMRRNATTSSTSQAKCDSQPHRDTALEGSDSALPHRDTPRGTPTCKVDFPPLTQAFSFEVTSTGHIIGATESQPRPQPGPTHPRANLSTQELIEVYLSMLKNHALWLDYFTSRDKQSPECSEYPNLDSSGREGDKREPIPPHEREFYCTSREPAEFAYGVEQKGRSDSGDGLTEAHMAKRWMGDYVRGEQGVEKWFADAELSIPEELRLVSEKRKLASGLVRARIKFISVGKKLEKSCKVVLEGNALS